MSIIKTDMAVAKEIHKTNIRNARVDKLTALDIEFQKAQETSADTTTIVAKKQALRDATNIVDSATITATDVVGVTNELKAVWNTDVLGDNPLY